MSDLTQIQTFIEVAESGSFAEASRQLTLPRSTVSARIKVLEKRLKVRLFNRNTRRVSLTNEGEEYLLQCRKAIALLNRVEDTFSQTQHLSGRVRLTVPVAVPKRPLSRLLADFSQYYPNIVVDVTVTDEPLDLVADNIDLALRGRVPGDLDLIAKELGRTEVSYFASPHYLQSVGDLALDTLLAEHCIFSPGQSGAGSAAITTANFELARELAVKHQGVVALPEQVCTQAILNKELVKVETDHRPASLPVYLVYPSRLHLAPRVRVLIDYFYEHHREYGVTYTISRF